MFEALFRISNIEEHKNMEHLQYPIGKFEPKENYTIPELRKYIRELERFPAKWKKLANSLTEEELETPYRPEGWTARQVVHHLADSHANWFIRIQCAMTEDSPYIKPYHEDRWATLPDHKLPIKSSLLIIEGIHKRACVLLRSLDKKGFKQCYVHPEYKKIYTLAVATALYAWHSEHHYQHLLLCKKAP